MRGNPGGEVEKLGQPYLVAADPFGHDDKIISDGDDGTESDGDDADQWIGDLGPAGIGEALEMLVDGREG